MIIDALIDKIVEYKNPSVVGLDTCVGYLPNSSDIKDNLTAAKEVLKFNKRIVDKICDFVPAVKVQVAYYEQYGVPGFDCFFETLSYAKSRGMYVISDVKRNDISSTAKAYSNAYLGVNDIGQKGFSTDFITVNGYLGSDGIIPFVEDCKSFDKGLFVLVRTSNPSSNEFQCLTLSDGKTVYQKMGEAVEKWGEALRGKYGYSAIGAVVGGTHKEECIELREKMPHTFFLIPGYGVQGGSAEMLRGCFDSDSLGGIVNSSRGILCAYKKPRYDGLAFDDAARQAAVDMRDDLRRVLN